MAVFSTFPTWAGSISGTKIVRISSADVGNLRGREGIFVVEFDKVLPDRPSCATVTSSLAIDPTTDIGKAQIAQLFTAQAQGTLLTVVGRGTCTIWDKTEDLSEVYAPGY